MDADLEQAVPFAVQFMHRLRFTRDALATSNRTLADVVGVEPPGRCLFFVDEGLLDAQPDLPARIERYAAAHRDRMIIAGPTQRVPGGEAVKNNPRLMEPILQAMSDAGLCRRSYVVVLGGGAVLDVVGFAAAIAHRGLRLVRLPSTTLAQADSGVGVKNGINGFGKKNYLGTFSPPWAVINDAALLHSLSDRDWRAGLSEAVKVALVKDATFFAQIEAATPVLRRRDEAAIGPIIRRSAQLHLEHITTGGDAFELDRARPLDFGHWAAHQLETMTRFELRHGEAVAIGVALDVTYSQHAGLLHAETAARIRTCLRGIGLPIFHDAMRRADALLAGLDQFREHLGGRLTVTLLEGVGRARDVHELNRPLVQRAIDTLAHEA